MGEIGLMLEGNLWTGVTRGKEPGGVFWVWETQAKLL